MNYEYAVAQNETDNIIYGPTDKETAYAALKSFQDSSTFGGSLFVVVHSVSDWREIH